MLNGNLPGARLEAGHFLLRILLNLYDAFVLTVSLAQCIDEVSVVRVRVSYFKELAQCHTAIQWLRQDLNLDSSCYQDKPL